MILALLLLIGGAVVLTVGAESAIRGAGKFATARRISPFTLGALLFGVDLESLGAVLIASGRNQPALAAGEAFGTIVFLFGVGFGIALLVARQPVASPSQPMVLWPAAGLVLCALALWDETVTRYDGFVLVLSYILYIGLVVREQQTARAVGEHIEHEAAEVGRIPPVALLIGGLVLVYVGANVLVGGGIRILERTGLTAGFVGAAIIGALASADEVLLEVLPIRRGMTELATGNLFGTVAAFSTAVIGVAALIRPLDVDSSAESAFLAAAVLYTVVATVLLARGKAGKVVGVALLFLYGMWVLLAARI